MKNLIIALILAATTSIGMASAADEKPVLTKKQAETLALSARTAADHQLLAKYYRQLAAGHTAQAKYHEEMMASYGKNPSYQSDKYKSRTMDHCLYFVKSSRESAEKMQEMAAMHEEMAQLAEKK